MGAQKNFKAIIISECWSLDQSRNSCYFDGIKLKKHFCEHAKFCCFMYFSNVSYLFIAGMP